MHELLAVATMFLVVIYMFDFRASRSAHDTSGDLIILTYAISVIMPILYILHNFFRFRTHADLHAEEREDYEHEEDGLQPFPDGHEIEIIPTIPACITALLTLASMTACVIYLVTNVSEASHSLAVPVGTFLVPVGLKISVHFTAIRNAYNNKMDRALTSVVGGTLRTIFLLAPIFVFFGLIIHQPMTLLFDQLQVVVVALAMWLISPVMASGTSTFLNGAQLLLVYVSLPILLPSSSD